MKNGNGQRYDESEYMQDNMNQPVDIFSNKLIENILENDLLNDAALNTNKNSAQNIIP